ncbi:MAG: response regulator, partial [Pseudomonadota bacterium]
MTGRILIVDDILMNTKLLEARLTAEYYTVLTADNGYDAIEICKRGECDLVLLDVMMPNLTGFETCRLLKQDSDTLHIPIVLVTALDSARDRVEGLEAGADDFLTKPVREMALLARVKSLLRLKLLVDELRMRAMTAHDVKTDLLVEKMTDRPTDDEPVVIVDDRPASSDRLRRTLVKAGYRVTVETDPQVALINLAEQEPILAIINLELESFDGLRLCSQLRSLDRTRNLPLLAVSREDDEPRLMRALDLGVNDYITRPIEPNELLARCMTQLRRRRYTDFLRQSVQATMEMAVKD